MEHLRLLSEPEQRSEALTGTGPDFCEPNNRYLKKKKKTQPEVTANLIGFVESHDY